MINDTKQGINVCDEVKTIEPKVYKPQLAAH